MLYLLFEIGADRYALAGRDVMAVEPSVCLKEIPKSVAGIAGVFDYHGEAVPVVDLSAMALGRPARADFFSTRIILMADPEGSRHLLGLLAEKATETARFDDTDFQDPGVASPDAPYLGPIARDGRGFIQRVDAAKLLKPEVRAVLWSQAADAFLNHGA